MTPHIKQNGSNRTTGSHASLGCDETSTTQPTGRTDIDGHYASQESPLAGFPRSALGKSLDDLKHLDFESFCAKYHLFRGQPVITAHLDWLVSYFLFTGTAAPTPELEACKQNGQPFWRTAEGRSHMEAGLQALYDQAVVYAGDDLRISPSRGHLNYLSTRVNELVGVLIRILPAERTA